MPNDKIKENLKPLTNLIDSKFAELSQTLTRQSRGINAALPIIQSDRSRVHDRMPYVILFFNYIALIVLDWYSIYTKRFDQLET